MDTTKAMTVIVELFEQDEGSMIEGSRMSQVPPKARKLRVALIYWLANISKCARTAKSEDIKQLMNVAQECINFVGASFLPSKHVGDQTSGENLDGLSLILWMFERFFTILSTIDVGHPNSRETLDTMNSLMKLLEEFDRNIFDEIANRIAAFFLDTAKVYMKDDCTSTVKLLDSDLEFFTEDFEFKHCHLPADGVKLNGLTMINRIISCIIAIYSDNFTALTTANSKDYVYDICQATLLSLECGADPILKINCLDFLGNCFITLHESFQIVSNDSKFLHIFLPVVFTDITALLECFGTESSSESSPIIDRCLNLASLLSEMYIEEHCEMETVDEIADICVSFMMESPKCNKQCIFFKTFIDVICSCSKKNTKLLMAGAVFDLFEFFLANPPDMSSFNTVSKCLATMLVLLQSDNLRAGSAWLSSVGECDLMGIFSKPDSPGPSNPAKRQRTDDSSNQITAQTMASFCKDYPLIGMILKHLSKAIGKMNDSESPYLEPYYNTLLLSAIFCTACNKYLNANPKTEVVARFSGIFRTIFGALQKSLIHLLDGINPTKDFPIIGTFISFFQELTALQFPDKFFDSSQLQVFAGVASLPWLPNNQQNWWDLKLPSSCTKLLLVCSSKISAFDNSFLESAIDCMTLLPREVCVQWRPIIFRDCFKSNNLSIAKHAVRRFPYLLHVMGPTYNALVYDYFHNIVKTSDINRVEIGECVASMLGELACVISRQCKVFRDPGTEFLRITCSCREEPVAKLDDSSSVRSASRSVSAAMFQPLIGPLLNMNCKSIHQFVAKSCKQIFSHLSFAQTESVQLLKETCIPLLTAEDDYTRLSFGKSLAGVADVSEELKISILEKLNCQENNSQLREYSNTIAASSLLFNSKDKVFSGFLTYLVDISLTLPSLSQSKKYSGPIAEVLLMQAVVTHNPDRPFMVFVECSADLGEAVSKKLISAGVVANQIANGDKDRARRRTISMLLQIFEIICRNFRFTDLEHCFSMVMPVVLPRLVTSSSADMPIRVGLLEYLAEQYRMSPRHLLADHIVRIWTYVLCYAQTAQAIEAANSVVRQVAKTNLDEMVSRDSQKACFQLVSKLGVNRKQALKGLRFLAEHERGNSHQKLTDSQFVDFLSQRFLGILLFLDTQFQSGAVCSAEKLELVNGLCELLQIVGPAHVNTVRVKLLATLRIILKLKAKRFLENALKAWSLFVKYLESDSLAYMLPQILVSLIPLSKMFPGTVDGIYDNVFNLKTQVVVKCIDEISYIVVDAPEFAKHIRGIPDAASSRRCPKSFALACARGCANESSEVRLLALSRLKSYLSDCQTMLMSNFRPQQLDQEWGLIYGQLLKCFHDTDLNVRLAATEVFGLFGAVNPSRLPALPSSNVTHLTNTNLSLSLDEVTNDTGFAYNLILDVCRVFLAADDTKVQDAAAYALQQLLSTFGVNESLLTSSQLQTNSSFGIRLWNRFPPSTQQLLKPYLKTKYVLTVKFDPSQVKTPFFGQNDRLSQYKEWLCAFTHYLIQSLPSSQSLTSHASQLTNCFQACKAIVRYDAALALFLLPYIALLVVTNSQDPSGSIGSLANDIGLEMQAVVDACVAANDHKLVVANSDASFRSSAISGREGGMTPSLLSQGSCYNSSQLPMAAQAVFSVTDHFSRWLEKANIRNAAHQQRAMLTGRRAASDKRALPPAVPLLQVEAVRNFLEKIPPLNLAIAAANCRYPARAMRFFEDYLASQSSTSYQVTTAGANFLQKLFMHLGEQDGVLGVAATFCHSPTIEQHILRHEINGQLSDALTCYEQAIDQQPDNFDFYRGVIGCLLSLGRDTAALHTVAGIVGRQEESSKSPVEHKFLPYQVEALGRLGNWSKLENCLKPLNSSEQNDPAPNSVIRNCEWPIGFWSAVVSLRKGDSGIFNQSITSLRKAELGPLSAASLEAASYVRGYGSIVKMHVLSELEMLGKYLLLGQPSTTDKKVKDEKSQSSKIADTLALFDVRLAMTEKSLEVREPLLQFRRLATNLLTEGSNSQMLPGLNSRLGRLWLESARLARKAGRYETAYGHLLSANAFADPGELRLETAKWLWARGSQEDALSYLEKWLRTGNIKDQLTARMLCLWTRYNEETAMLDSSSLVKHYKSVIEANQRSEESYFYLAKYLSKLLITAQEKPGQAPTSRNSIGHSSPALPDGNLHLEAIRNFGHSLRYGSKFILESMPQLVSLWLDYALAVHNALQQPQQYSGSALSSARQIMMSANQEVRVMMGPVPAYQFLVVFPQLISRICHPQKDTSLVLQEVAAYVMAAYPQQTTWLAIAVSRSTWPLRRKRCEDLFVRLRQMKLELNKFISDIMRLTDRLCEVCDKSTDRDPNSDGLMSLSVNRDFRQMKRLVEDQSFTRILIPLQHLLWPTLPTGRRGNPLGTNSTTQHQPFPNDEIYFAGFGDEVGVMKSLQRPKRLLVRGSNGKMYGFLCKPKEDLRKDSRWMEYVTVVNSFLRRDADACRRRLSIRTFAVIPLNEDCGILEWVDDTHGIRPILSSIYKERGIEKDSKFLISCKLPADAPLSEKLRVFKTRLLPTHPPVLGEWFRRNWFTDASAWHEARLAFSRSAAVMSIAGYILGLGDRHGENILIDAKSGEVVHVDFSCLFNKADAFEYPEVVPFRLTHNMTHAMGPTGYEGVFRKACEVTMRIARHHSDALLIVLKSFVHDPLVEWQKPMSKNKRAENDGEIINSQAVKVLNDARNRLKGCVTSSSVDLPLSIEGHVNYVIRQATDDAHLARMYIGWGPQL